MTVFILVPDTTRNCVQILCVVMWLPYKTDRMCPAESVLVGGTWCSPVFGGSVPVLTNICKAIINPLE